MTTRRRKKRLLLPLLLPIIAVRLTGMAVHKGGDVARSTRKRISKHVSRARRRTTNERADTRDVALHNSQPGITQRNHNECSFLKLPLELREQIYDLCTQPATFRIHELNVDGYKLIATQRGHDLNSYENVGILPRRGIVVRTHLLALPLVCRQIYSETVENMYRRNSFRFTDHKLAFLIPSLAVFPRKHLDTLRSLELSFCINVLSREFRLDGSSPRFPPGPTHEHNVDSWAADALGLTGHRRKWIRLWQFLATLLRLERLHVEFTTLPPLYPWSWVYTSDDTYGWILAPLLHFKRRERLREFVVEWQGDWRLSEGWEKSMPFEMKWK